MVSEKSPRARSRASTRRWRAAQRRGATRASAAAQPSANRCRPTGSRCGCRERTSSVASSLHDSASCRPRRVANGKTPSPCQEVARATRARGRPAPEGLLRCRTPGPGSGVLTVGHALDKYSYREQPAPSGARSMLLEIVLKRLFFNHFLDMIRRRRWRPPGRGRGAEPCPVAGAGPSPRTTRAVGCCPTLPGTPTKRSSLIGI